MFADIINPLFSLIYPQECGVCRHSVEMRSDGAACAECWASTRIFTGSEMLCEKCGAYFGEKAAPSPVFCRQCDGHAYDTAFAIGIYEKALAASIIRLKSTPHLATRLTNLIKDRARNLKDIDIIIPIPLSKGRKLERGFNQAEIVAAQIGKACGAPVDPHSLVRHLHTHIHRIGMDQKARELSVRKAFSILRPKLIAGRNILLVDDVLTSGATASQCAETLKKNGAGQVNVFTLARAAMRQ